MNGVRCMVTIIAGSSGGGNWDMKKPIPERWTIGYENLKFHIKPTSFKHTGLFPEQAANWSLDDG